VRPVICRIGEKRPGAGEAESRLLRFHAAALRCPIRRRAVSDEFLLTLICPKSPFAVYPRGRENAPRRRRSARAVRRLRVGLREDQCVPQI
jgi:hypothetical protein